MTTHHTADFASSDVDCSTIMVGIHPSWFEMGKMKYKINKSEVSVRLVRVLS
jgi:hypothetical protein